MSPIVRTKAFLPIIFMLFIAVFLGCGRSTEDSGSYVPFSETPWKLTASDAQTDGWFGQSVSINGDYAIVGAIGEDGGPDGTVALAGAAYIFHRTGPNTWDTGTKIVAPDAQAGDRFGYSVSISGDYAIVGAYREDGGVGDPLISAGAAYIYHRTDTNTWDTGTKIVAPDAQSGDYFGLSVSISGEYAIVGSYGTDGDGVNYMGLAGAAFIYHRTGLNTWDTGTKIVAPDVQLGDMFGWSVSISGDYAIVGALYEDGALINAGAAYIYHRTDTNTWDTGTKIVAPDAREFDHFGFSVAINGGYAIVGSYYSDDTSSGNGNPAPGDPLTAEGTAYIFQRTGPNTWDAGTKIVAPDAQPGDNFGLSVSINGNYAIVGAHSNGSVGQTLVESAYIYHRTDANAWDEGTKIADPDEQLNDGFGTAVSISGSHAIVGAFTVEGSDGNTLDAAGAAYIY